MKRILGIIVVVALVGTIVAGCGQKTEPPKTEPAKTQAPGPEAKKFKVGMVTDVTGLAGSKENKSFQDLAWDGLQKAKSELGVETTVVESREVADLVPNLRKLADQKYDLIVGVGFLFTDAITDVSKQYPGIKFAIIDSVVNAPNVVSYVFKEEEGSFLAGALAAGMTSQKSDKTNDKKVIGFVGGMDVPLIQKFEAGYIAGAKTIDPSVQVLSAYAGSFDDPGKGKELTLNMYNKGADIVYHAAGITGLGTIQAAKEKNFWAIGVNNDQYSVAPGFVLASMIKGVEVATFEAAKSVVKGSFKGGVVVLDTKAGGIDLGGLDHVKGQIPDGLLKKIANLKQMIIEGKFKVPTTLDEAKKFTPPTGF